MATTSFVVDEVLDAAKINGRMVTTWHPISEQTVTGSSVPDVTFSGISDVYEHLILVFNARGTAAATTVDLDVVFNADTGGNYGRLTWDGSHTSASPAGSYSANANAAQALIMAGDSWSVGSCGSGYLLLSDYAWTWRKSGTAISAAFDGDVGCAARHRSIAWDSTAAINSIKLVPNSGNFAVNSHFSLYGLGYTKTFVDLAVLTADDVNKYLSTACHPLTEFEFSSASSSLSISGIPATYKHLLVVARGRGTTAAATIDVNTTFNNDTAANYSRLTWDASETSPNPAGNWAGNLANSPTSIFAAGSWAAGSSGSSWLLIPNYASLAHNKILLTQSAAFNGAATEEIECRQRFGSWASTAAVNRLDLTASAGNFSIGTRFSLYGIG